MSENENLEVQENENPEVNSNPEGGKIATLDEAMAELKRVRQEAASRRIANRELEEKAKRWTEYEESQKTELQKLQEALAAKEKALADYEFEKTKRAVVKEFGLEDDDLDLLTGADEASIRKQAERLKARVGKTNQSSRPADLLAGNRGTPVGSTSETVNIDDLFRAAAKRR